MATENIGSKYNTQIPSLTENADIQTALKIYHYGQSTEPTNLVADSVAGHLKNLEDTKVDIVPIQIVSGSGNNLNLKVTTGYYSVATNAIATAGSNYPADPTAGMLHVMNDGSGIVYQFYLSNLGKFYWRGYYSGAWTTWAQASDTTHSHSEFSALSGEISNKQATITGAASSVTSANLAVSSALVSDASGKIAASSTVSATELGYLNGVTSAIQGQLDSKPSKLDSVLTGTANAVNLTVSGTTTLNGTTTITGTTSLASTTSIGNVDSTEIGYLNGVTSGIQDQFTSVGTSLTQKPTTYMSNSTVATGKKIFIQSETPTGMTTGDLWFW